MQADARWAFARYRAIAHHLPTASRGFPPFSAPVPDLSAVIARYDGFILDAFGVLNIGGTAIPGAVERIAQIRAAGKKLVVLTNGASAPQAAASPSSAQGVPANWATAAFALAKLKTGCALATAQPRSRSGESRSALCAPLQ